jgi:putative transposase
MSPSYDKLVAILKSRLRDERLDALGRVVFFIRRLREVRAAEFVWSVVISRFRHGRPAFQQALQCYRQLTSTEIWRRPFQMRFKCAAAVTLFERAFEDLVAPWRNRAAARGIRHPLARHVADVVIVDGTTIRLSDSLRNVFRGTGKGSPAMLKVLFTISAFGMLPLAAQLANGADNDNKFFPRLDLFVRGTLFLFDKGFFVHTRLRAIRDAGHHFLCAMKCNSNPRVVRIVTAPRRVRARFDASSKPVFLRDLIARDARVASEWDLDVDVGGVACRLVIVPGRERKPRPYFTTLSRDVFRPRDVAEMYRLRWQIELVFKELKQHLNLGAVPTGDPFAAQVFVWASLIALAISRCLTACLWPCDPRVGLRSNKRPALTSRALRSLSALLPMLLTGTRPAAAILAAAIREQVDAACVTTRRDSFARLELALAA